MADTSILWANVHKCCTCGSRFLADDEPVQMIEAVTESRAKLLIDPVSVIGDRPAGVERDDGTVACYDCHSEQWFDKIISIQAQSIPETLMENEQ